MAKLVDADGIGVTYKIRKKRYLREVLVSNCALATQQNNSRAGSIPAFSTKYRRVLVSI